MNKQLQPLAYAFCQALEAGTDLSVATENTAAMLKKRNLLGQSDTLLSLIAQEWNRLHQIVAATIVSRFPITEQDRERIQRLLKERYQAKDVHITEQLDATVLGGVKIIVNDEVINATLSDKLRQVAVALQK